MCSYILGNPPFGGTTYTTDEQKRWLEFLFTLQNTELGLANYVTGWFVKASDYMLQNKHVHAAFVATNSICQGEQVNTLWGLLLDKGININFAYKPFQWSNDAAGKAAVVCVIVGFSFKQTQSPNLITHDSKTNMLTAEQCICISPYLTGCSVPTIVKSRNNALQRDINLSFGNKSADGGHLILTYEDGQKLLNEHPNVKPYIKKYIGSSELMKSEFRYCLWLKDEDKDKWPSIQNLWSM